MKAVIYTRVSNEEQVHGYSLLQGAAWKTADSDKRAVLP